MKSAMFGGRKASICLLYLRLRGSRNNGKHGWEKENWNKKDDLYYKKETVGLAVGTGSMAIPTQDGALLCSRD